MADQVVLHANDPTRASAVRANRWVYRMACSWMVGFTLIFGLYVGLPFLAPLFMRIGLDLPARAIYFIYSFFCHQLPQRSYFLFGEKLTYSLAEIQAVWQYTNDMIVLRQFNGNAQVGWKVAWSDRMVWMYTSMLLLAWVWYPLRRRLGKLPWQGLVLFLLPMAVDGFTHMISDFAGIGMGFRDTNAWLASILGDTLPQSFIAGDRWGSFGLAFPTLTISSSTCASASNGSSGGQIFPYSAFLSKNTLVSVASGFVNSEQAKEARQAFHFIR